MNLASALRSLRLNLPQVSYGWSRVHFLFCYGRGIWFFLRCFIFPLQEGWPYLVNLPFWQVSYKPLHAIFLRGKKLKVYEHQQGSMQLSNGPVWLYSVSRKLVEVFTPSAADLYDIFWPMAMGSRSCQLFSQRYRTVHSLLLQNYYGLAVVFENSSKGSHASQVVPTSQMSKWKYFSAAVGKVFHPLKLVS